MDKGILRFMAEAYLLLHPGPTLESVVPPDKGPKNKPPRKRRGHSNGNKESKKPPEEGGLS
jgi:hypothetical protein